MIEEPHEIGHTGNAIFVIGAARSGTTVLQNALNDARDIYLLGEPDLHLQDGANDFASRYNAMHRSWRNQETKITFCPILRGYDGSWKDCFDDLSLYYKSVGSKIVLTPIWSQAQYDRFCEFQIRHFYDAKYLFIFRSPETVIDSSWNFQAFSGTETSSAASLVANWMRTISTYTRFTRILPCVKALFHEEMDCFDWQALSTWLGSSCDGAASYYQPIKASRTDFSRCTDSERHLIELSTNLYRDLQGVNSKSIIRPQAEQNENHLNADHFTPLGSLHRRANMIFAAAGQQS